MGPVRKRTFQNKGFREEPTLAMRIEEYHTHLQKEGVIIASEKVIVGVRGGGLALVTALPEVIERNCQRMGKKFKRGDVTFVLDVLKLVIQEIGAEVHQFNGTIDYVRDGKQKQRTLLLSNIVLPVVVEGVSRSTLFNCDLLHPSQRRNGLDVYRMKVSDLEMISERERELFSLTTD